jgi:hypothetical protein
MTNPSARFALVAMAAIPIVWAGDDEQKLSCSKDVVYNEQFLDEFPRAPAACREVVLKNGEKWIHYVTDVKQVKGNGEVTVSLQNAVGDSMGTLTLVPAPTARVTLEGKETKWSKLRPGDRLDFYVPSSRFGFYAQPGGSDLQELNIIRRTASK